MLKDTRSHAGAHTLTHSQNPRCIHRSQDVMARKTEIDFPLVTDFLTENKQRGQIYHLREVCEYVEGTECHG